MSHTEKQLTKNKNKLFAKKKTEALQLYDGKDNIPGSHNQGEHIIIHI